MKLIEIPDGEPVPGPGAYIMSMAHYHSQDCCPGPSISSSGLRRVWTQSPYHFWKSSDMNPNRFPRGDESPALALGKGAHALILGEEHFDKMFAYLPEDAPRRPTATQVAAFKRNGVWSEAAAPGAAFWEDWDTKHAGKTILTQDAVQKIHYMAESIAANPIAKEVLIGALTEVSLIWQDEHTGLWIKSRIDVIPTNGADFSDLKTFAPRTKSIKRAVHQAITDHEYPMQMALGQIAAREVLSTDAEDCVLVMVQSTEPYCTVPVRLDAEALHWGRVKIRGAIDTVANCLKTQHWPQPVEGVLDYTMPPSSAERLKEQQLNGDLPILEV